MPTMPSCSHYPHPHHPIPSYSHHPNPSHRFLSLCPQPSIPTSSIPIPSHPTLSQLCLHPFYFPAVLYPRSPSHPHHSHPTILFYFSTLLTHIIPIQSVFIISFPLHLIIPYSHLPISPVSIPPSHSSHPIPALPYHHTPSSPAAPLP